MRQTQEQPTREKALVEVLVVTKKCEQGGQPARRIGRFIKSQSLGRRRVTFVVMHYEDTPTCDLVALCLRERLRLDRV